MKTYCVKCKKDTEIVRTKNNRLVMQSKCSVLDYEVGNVQAFIDEFKNKKIEKPGRKYIKEKKMREKLEREMSEKVEKEMREKLEKELKDKNKELKISTNNQVTN